MHRDVLHTYPSEMAQNFWTAIFAFAACFVVTFVVSLFTKPREESEFVGLVYSLTERPKDSARAWYSRPATSGHRRASDGDCPQHHLPITRFRASSPREALTCILISELPSACCSSWLAICWRCSDVLTMFNIGADKSDLRQLVGLQYQLLVGPGDVSVWRLHVHHGPPRHLGRSHRRGKSGRAAVG